MSAQPQNRTAAGTFKKGQSGNPGGKPKGLASAIREKVPAAELAEHFMAIWQLDTAKLEALSISLEQVTLAERNKAAEWLSDHGYGKAPAYAPVEGGDPLELDDVDRVIAGLVDELAGPREAQADRAAQVAAVAEARAGRAASAG